MKHLFFDLWANIRKSPFLFLFLFFQIVITSLVLYTVLANYYWTDEQSGNAQIAWGDKEYLKLFSKSNVPSDIILPLVGSRIKNEKTDIELFEKLDTFYNEVQKIDGLLLMPNHSEAPIILNNPKEWDEEDKKFGEHMMFDVNDRGSFSRVNTLFIGSEYLDYFNVKLSEGEYFQEEDYLYDKEYTPILMGESYRKYYSIGEEFTVMMGNSYKDERTLK